MAKPLEQTYSLFSCGISSEDKVERTTPRLSGLGMVARKETTHWGRGAVIQGKWSAAVGAVAKQSFGTFA